MVERVCSARQVVDLATKNYLKIQGLYQCIAPPTRSLSLVIDADQPVKLRDLLVGGTAIKIKGRGSMPRNRALGWYGDEIHIFKNDLREIQHWKFVTSLGSREANVPEIENFLHKHWTDLRVFMAKVVEAVKDVYLHPLAHENSAEHLTGRVRSVLEETGETIIGGFGMVHINGQLLCDPVNVEGQ